MGRSGVPSTRLAQLEVPLTVYNFDSMVTQHLLPVPRSVTRHFYSTFTLCASQHENIRTLPFVPTEPFYFFILNELFRTIHSQQLRNTSTLANQNQADDYNASQEGHR
jgi:hypothetical protein